MSNALVLYAKSPIAGFVKTRLTLGPRGISEPTAALFYRSLLEDLLSLLSSSTTLYDLYICPKDLSSFCKEVSVPSSFSYIEDKGFGDLGRSLFSTIERLNSTGYKSVCIIGSDLPSLTLPLIENVFSLLLSYDFVLGPDYGGGMYLIATRTADDIFSNIVWSEGNDFAILHNRIAGSSYSSYILDKLADIDRAEDLYKFRDLVLHGDKSFSLCMPRTYNFLLNMDFEDKK